MRIALGLAPHLEAFAAEHEADTWKVWGGDDWKISLYRLCAVPETEIFWNLTDVQIAEGLQRASLNLNIEFATDWELMQFKGNSDWLDRCHWFRDGAACLQPEELS